MAIARAFFVELHIPHMTHLFDISPFGVQTHSRRPFTVHFAGNEDRGAGGGSGEAAESGGGGDDGGWEMESHSVGEGMAPNDATEQSQSADGVNDQPEGGDTGDGEESTGVKPAAKAGSEAARDDKTGQFKPGDKGAKAKDGKPGTKGQNDLDKRIQTLRREVDTITFQRHRVKEDADRENLRLEGLRREAAELEAKIKAGGGSSADKDGIKPGDKAGATDADPMPEHPKYTDFDTDAEYDAAVAKWRGELVPAWDTRRLERMKREIQDGVDNKMSAKDGETRTAAVMTRIGETLNAVAETKEDWSEKAEALKDIRSPWVADADLEKHGSTPFLSDLSRTLLAEGHKEGAELLYWLGSDVERAAKVAELLPSRALRDAMAFNPSSVISLLEHFVTDDGRTEFEGLKRMHPVQAATAVGALILRLASASSGSDAGRRSITSAKPAARPPAGGARTDGKGGKPGSKDDNFESWMEAEDARDEARRKEALGLA